MRRPAVGLHRAGALEREFVEILFAPTRRRGCGPRRISRQQVAVGADVVEPVVVHPDVGDVMRHARDGPFAAEFQERFVAGGVVLQDRRAVHEALRPFGPAARGVFAVAR